jgi:Xaa-Pro aminopeptidase
MKNSETLLLVADSDHDADMLYAVGGMFVPDPFIYFQRHGRSSIVMSDLEIDRAHKQARHCRVLSLSAYQSKLRREGVKYPGVDQVLPRVLREKGIRRVVVPHDFPHGLAVELQKQRIRVKARPGAFFPEREYKSAGEVRKLAAALGIAEVGMEAAMQTLRASKIGRGRQLIFRNAPLTSERLRAAIDSAIVQAGGLSSHTIVAGGDQACDPHETGFGLLRANEPIILDIFPRSQKTGYFGDITRTVVRGRASEAVRKLYDTVFRGQQIGFKTIRAGVPTVEVHKAVQELFMREGYKTGKVNGRMQGFFHGTGHGLGLEIHEPPRIGQNSAGNLKTGQVVTVEPGLYYPGLGGIRLEDVAVVTDRAPRNLTRFAKILEV